MFGRVGYVGSLGRIGVKSTPQNTPDIEIITRDGSTILTRSGATVIARKP